MSMTIMIILGMFAMTIGVMTKLSRKIRREAHEHNAQHLRNRQLHIVHRYIEAHAR